MAMVAMRMEKRALERRKTVMVSLRLWAVCPGFSYSLRIADCAVLYRFISVRCRFVGGQGMGKIAIRPRTVPTFWDDSQGFVKPTKAQ